MGKGSISQFHDGFSLKKIGFPGFHRKQLLLVPAQRINHANRERKNRIINRINKLNANEWRESGLSGKFLRETVKNTDTQTSHMGITMPRFPSPPRPPQGQQTKVA
jgi:hypothetical protein